MRTICLHADAETILAGVGLEMAAAWLRGGQAAALSVSDRLELLVRAAIGCRLIDRSAHDTME